ncbi:MAG: hypothetical protein A3C47_01625 [Omnitrophica bacterium RIFCSPHIGHO2_02_FULL_51_18]|nr:MAG: hypothetical protein A3C47_01625 [Omnitrophica bacterium RIFCSPHIGHO2_02_FULL_51_18]
MLIFLCGLMMVAFLFSLSRGGILSLGLAAVVMTSLLVKRGILKQAWWIWATLLIFAGAMMLLFGVEPLVERLQSLRMIVEVDESVSRLRIWQAAIGLISQNFWLGTGPGTFGDAVLFFKAEPFHGRPVHAHNDYLELMADGGIFVFLAFLVLFFAVMRKGWRLFHETEKRSKLGLAAGVLTSGMALAIHSTVDFNFHVPANAVYFTAVAALMLSRSEGGHYTGAIQRKAVVSVFSLLFIVTLAGSVFFGLSDFFKWRGQKALERKDYSQAVRAMTRSLVFNPSSAETFYLRGLAHERAWLKDTRGENDSLIQSISDFRKASRLNPLEPYYEYHKTKMSCRSGAIRSDREVIAAYEKVIQKEPKDPDLYFLSGRDLLKLAGKTRETLEQKAVSLLKECMNMDRLYRDRIYGLLWDYKRNLRFLESFSLETGQGLRGLLKFIEKWELWSYHRKLFLKSVGVDACVHDKEAAALYADSRPGRFFSMEDFDKVPGDEAAMGKNFYRKGNISKSVSLNGKRSLLILRAKSRKVAGIYGYLLVRLDHKPVQSFYVRSPDYEEYPAILSHEPGTHTLTLSYLNDKVDPERGGDRNIWIERIEIRDA